MTKPRVVILGAGPAGLGAAFRLTQSGLADVQVIERNGWVGGNTASFDLAGVRVDYGSHRLHPACDPTVLRDIGMLLDGDLLDRPRHGRIRLRGRWIHFPLKPLDLILRLPPSFALGILRDLSGKVTRKRWSVSGDGQQETFASVLEAGLGRTICRDFYFPYASKIWGLPPDQLSAIQALRRVSSGSIEKMIQRVAGMLPGLKPPGRGRFFYPRKGYGQICEAYARAAQEAGAKIWLNAEVQSVQIDSSQRVVHYICDGEERSVAADHVWSTIPITNLAKLLEPDLSPECTGSAGAIDYRAMILIYLVLEQERFSQFDAYYFPESEVPITRLSEPKNFSDGYGAFGVSVLCAELPCSPTDSVWSQTDEELGAVVCSSLAMVGQPLNAKIKQVEVRRIRHAYPIYRRGYERAFERLDARIDEIEGLLTFGRQGLFSHDNLHHALYMAYSAAACLRRDGTFDRDRWVGYRRIFETHVVED